MNPDGAPDAASDGSDAGAEPDAAPLCITALFGRYLVRADSALLFDSTVGQRAVLDGAGQPLMDVVGVHDGYAHGCAVLGTAGTAWCWRVTTNGNLVGQLGSGATDTPSTPRTLFEATQVLTGPDQPLENVVAISREEVNGIVDGRASCAVTAAGDLYCWGDLTWLVNNGTTLTSPYAVPITTDGKTLLSGVRQVAVYSGYACAVVEASPSTHELWCWGSNGSGQLGLDDITKRQYPALVTGLDNPSTAVAQSNGAFPTTCALDDSRVRCWGENGVGQTGTGNPLDPTLARTLVTVMDGTPLDDVIDLHGGFAQFCALRGSNTVWCWGRFYEGYASAYGITNIVLLGGTEAGPRYLTSDGMYHIGNTVREPSCGTLP